MQKQKQLGKVLLQEVMQGVKLKKVRTLYNSLCDIYLRVLGGQKFTHTRNKKIHKPARANMLVHKNI